MSDPPSPSPAPKNYWSTMIAVAGLALSAVAIWIGVAASNRETVLTLERRLCRLEAKSQVGDCGR